ncbi:MAG TPA: glycosyltransferase family 8 protein [Arsenicitalea sp.]|jgi:lipopolysaccharide biosynthesis glycosyltransferase|nr:glycosyltransferase family 8 protein [Arsenicitalea sp.]
MTSAAPIHIALTFDDNFWAPAYATMRSVCLASRRPQTINFHLFYRTLSAAHRAEFDAIGKEFGATLIDYDLTAHQRFNDFLKGLSYHTKLTNLVYARLLLDELLPQGIDRLIYLDCDIFVRGPIEDLAELDLQGKAIGAVLDAGRHKQMLGHDLRQNLDLFDFHFAYFNAGMLVIDRKAFAAANLPEQTRLLHESGALSRIQYDQAILNLVFKDNWLPLDFRWNLICPSPEHEMLEPQLLHYTGHKKPWSLLSTAAFSKAYRHTMTNAIFYRFWRERVKRRLGKPLRKLLGR